MRYWLLAGLVLALVFWGTYANFQHRQTEQYQQALETLSEHLAEGLNLNEQLGQLLLIYFPLEENALLRDLKPGAIFIHRDNLPEDDNGRHDIGETRKRINNLNQWYLNKGLPLPAYAIDQEGGHVKRLNNGVPIFPSAMALAEGSSLFSPGLGYVGESLCLELKSIGIQWVLGPVVDIQNNPENPVIRTRSFSSSAERVATLAGDYLQGLRRAGCITTLKHFPGHGDTHSDSHLELPTIDHDLKHMQANELLPYHRLLGQGNDALAVMSAHIVFAQHENKPATVSTFWLNNYLRRKLGFKGVVVTDDLGMKGIKAYASENNLSQAEVAVESFKAGADVLLLFKHGNHRALKKALLRAVKKGQVSKARIKQSVKRVLKMKLASGILDENLQQPGERALQKALQTVLSRRQRPSRRYRATELNGYFSSGGIKTLLRPRTIIKPRTLYTDLEPGDEYYSMVQNFDGPVRPLTELAKEQDSALILNTKITGFKRFLAEQISDKTANWYVYTVVSPFPYSSLGGMLGAEDALIASFSDTPESVKTLIQVALGSKLPPDASVLYKPTQDVERFPKK